MDMYIRCLKLSENPSKEIKCGVGSLASLSRTFSWPEVLNLDHRFHSILKGEFEHCAYCEISYQLVGAPTGSQTSWLPFGF